MCAEFGRNLARQSVLVEPKPLEVRETADFRWDPPREFVGVEEQMF